MLAGGLLCLGLMVITCTKLGSQIHPLSQLRWQEDFFNKPSTYAEAFVILLVAESALEPLFHMTIYQFRMSVQAGQALLAAVRKLRERIGQTQDKSSLLTFSDVYPITSALTTFEAVFGSELSMKRLYLVMQKAGFDTDILISNGAACFPKEIWSKAPEAIADLQQGTKCLAYEVFTASGFHFHRANEAVLHRYWDAVATGRAKPTSRNMGDYLNEMKKHSLGNPKVLAALKDLKDLHRNPLVHPEHSIETADEAIALMNSVHNVIVHMLNEIPAALPGIQPPRSP
jgi:hypothetical protein